MSETAPGRSYPAGATVEADGVNFCVYSKHASSVELLLFADAAPAEVIRLDEYRLEARSSVIVIAGRA